jgi:hypothetical protein
VRRQQSGRSVPRLASRHRAAILSDIIINENLKLLQIIWLEKWMFRLIFLLGHIVLATELMVRLGTTQKTAVFKKGPGLR